MLRTTNMSHRLSVICRFCSLLNNTSDHVARQKTSVSWSRRPSNFESSPTKNLNKMWTKFSFSSLSGTVLVQARDSAKLNMEIQSAIDERKYDYTWKLFEQHMHMEGFPRKSVVNKLLTGFAESLDVHWLEKASGIVEQAFEESKQNLLEKEPLIYLALGLAKRDLTVPASIILRKLVETEQFPPVNAWSAILAHLSRTAPGASIAAELVIEIGYLFQGGRIDPRKKSNAPLLAMKPNTISFSIALAGCLLFGLSRKAEQLLDMMPRIGVKADANLLVIMADIYERNGRREELRKLQRHMDEVFNLSDVQLRQFYKCLLTCHLKFGDLESASRMVLDMLRKAKEARNSLAAANLALEVNNNGNMFPAGQFLRKGQSPKESDILGDEDSLKNRIISYEEFFRDRNFWELGMETKSMLDFLLGKLHKQADLISMEHGILQPTEEIYVKLVKAFLEAGKIRDLVQFLIKAEKEDSPASNDDSALVHVINACILLGWLDEAYDLLDEMRIAGVRTSSSVYTSLLKEYCKANRVGEVAALLRDAKRDGIQLDSSCYDMLIQSQVLQKDTQGALNLFKEMKENKLAKGGNQEFDMLVKGCAGKGEASLMAKLLREIKEGQKLECGVHDWNNVIHFFCKKRLMQDAEKALKKMTSLGHSPNASTFHSMVTAYAAIGGKYVEVTELWGEMKSVARSTGMKFDQELLDSVLYTFVRGGFFVRANEVVDMLEKGNMFIDKYKYRMLFLKYHKTLYKGKSPKFQTESQLKKREAALEFKKWIGLN